MVDLICGVLFFFSIGGVAAYMLWEFVQDFRHGRRLHAPNVLSVIAITIITGSSITLGILAGGRLFNLLAVKYG